MNWLHRSRWMLIAAFGLLTSLSAVAQRNTWLQEGGPWLAEADVQSDVVLAYGYQDLPARAAQWRQQGYHAAFMTGVAWGGYQEFLEGRFDGVNHADHAQTRRNGTPILHDPTVPYMVPSEAFCRYMVDRLKVVIDAGIDDLCLEEPEFWAAAGYGEAFKREFRAMMGQDWIAPHDSPDARYHVSQAQYRLYGRAIEQIMSACKQYGAEKGRTIKCYVATHSLVNYAAWGLVTPESSLNQIKPLDGFILQIWTGTARTPNVYRGVACARTFETAFLEYTQMVDMFGGTGREMIGLVDPIEDDPKHGWDDYEANYKRVLAGALFQPELTQFEIVPWPSRVFAGTYPASEATARDPNAPRVPIPADYAAVYLACSNALADMPKEPVAWQTSSRNVGVLVADSLMFQRDKPAASDPQLSSFFGLAMPLIKRAMPPRVISMETLGTTAQLGSLDVLLLTYEGMKPPSAESHRHLAEWVRTGHALVLIDNFTDPYNGVKAWWNSGKRHSAHPAQHLLEELGVAKTATEGTFACGQGVVRLIHQSPAALAHQSGGDAVVAEAVREALVKLQRAADWKDQAHMELRRGAYCVAANMDEATSAVQRISGRLVNLYEARFPVQPDPELRPGGVGLYVDLDKLKAPAVVAASTRVRNVKADQHQFSFETRGPLNTPCRIRLLLPQAPKQALAREDQTATEIPVQWDAETRTALLEITNKAKTIGVECRY